MHELCPKLSSKRSQSIGNPTTASVKKQVKSLMLENLKAQHELIILRILEGAYFSELIPELLKEDRRHATGIVIDFRNLCEQDKMHLERVKKELIYCRDVELASLLVQDSLSRKIKETVDQVKEVAFQLNFQPLQFEMERLEQENKDCDCDWDTCQKKHL